MDELLDLVNEKDEVIGEVWRSEANQNPEKIHRQVGIIIADGQNRIWMQQRSLSKDKNPGMWSISCAGHILKGEKPLSAAKRELKEELDLEIELQFFKKLLRIYPEEKHFTYFYTGTFNGWIKKPQKSEVIQVKKVDQEEFEQMSQKGLVTRSSEEWIREYWGIR
jgi:isopentenyldiphosphate isomerase